MGLIEGLIEVRRLRRVTDSCGGLIEGLIEDLFDNPLDLP